MKAVAHDGSRSEALGMVDLPVLVIHGSRDTLIDPSGGRRTAEVIPGARYLEIDGMGHDDPPAGWPEWVTAWSEIRRVRRRRLNQPALRRCVRPGPGVLLRAPRRHVVIGIKDAKYLF